MTNTPIPIHQPHLEYLSLHNQINEAMQSVAAAGSYILGQETEQFEREFSRFVGSDYAVGVGNGSDALYLALQALEVGRGDEVITTPFTFFATSEAILRVGATPVFVDIESEGFNIDVHQLEQAITSRTRVILPVHLFGKPCDMGVVRDIANRRNLYIVEDCAQATGATYLDHLTGRCHKAGSLGDVGCFSFFPTKNLGTLGDGGMVTTNSPEVFHRVEKLRRHGSFKKYQHDELGVNSRLDELQAAILRVKLPHLEAWNNRRVRIAEQYREILSSSDSIILPQHDNSNNILESDLPHAFHQFTVRLNNRKEVQTILKSRGIHTAVYYPLPLHLQPVHSKLKYSKGAFPWAEHAATTCLSLPMHPNLSDEELSRVASCLLEAVEQPHRDQAA